MILEGENAVLKNRELMGSTDPKNASENTWIRKLYGISMDKLILVRIESDSQKKKDRTFFKLKISKDFNYCLRKNYCALIFEFLF